jgi:hypothetical protein
MSLASFFNNSHFGATLTPLRDSTLLVYKSFPNHPIGLLPGDIVLGYEGVPWKNLYKRLLEAELPIKFGITGSTSEAWEHIYLSSAGLNWHLFDTIDILKYSNGDTLHFPTILLAGQKGRITGSDQVPVKGIKFWQEEGIEVLARDTLDNFTWLDTDSNADYFTWGKIEKTNIGYLYVATLRNAMHPNFSQNILNAVESLIYDSNVDGLIFDLRFNNGGSWSAMDEVFSLLCNTDFIPVKFYQRSNPDDHFLMKEWLQIFGPNKGTNLMLVRTDPSTYFDKPIAVITGPGCVSAGDQVALKFKYHPKARFFGKSTGGAFAAGFGLSPLNSSSEWLFAQPIANSAWFEDTAVFLTHTKLEVEEEIWLDSDSVALGIDNVVSRAVEWIHHGTSTTQNTPLVGADIQPSLVIYPNPISNILSLKTDQPGNYSISIYALNGQLIYNTSTDITNLQIDMSTFNSGVYLIRITSTQFSTTDKIVKL